MTDFKEAYEKAKEVLKKINYQRGKMVKTADIINAVEEITGVKVRFADFDFSKLASDSGDESLSRYGAAMYVSNNDTNLEARILLNSRETPEMQRFSLVHELGHLMLGNMEKDEQGYLFSTHIDMDITRFIDKEIDGDEFLTNEQEANIFALLVLIPIDSLLEVTKNRDSLEDIAKIFGVEKSALVSRFLLSIPG